MDLLLKLIVSLIIFLHFYFLWFEMFAWETRGRKIFKSLPPELFAQTKVLAANQGLYNGFLGAGLIWSLLIFDQVWQFNVMTFFLTCVAIAGLYGAFTADKKIFFVQALPAIVALILILLL